MSCSISHVAINADDLEGTRQFYTGLFGWNFEPWGPPGFLRTETDTHVVALQRRRDLGGVRATGFECTVAVPDIAAVAAGVSAYGGRVVMERATIPSVGELIFFADPSGNVAGAMQYSERAASAASTRT
jgi:predicted enzyme related to lactoylglutathione lyase